MELLIFGKFFDRDSRLLEIDRGIGSISIYKSQVFCIDTLGKVMVYDFYEYKIQPKCFKFPMKCVLISCGNDHCGLITDANECYMWGNNKYGALGVSSATKYSDEPLKVLSSASKVSCGGWHTAFIVDNKVYACGRGQEGQLGIELDSLYCPVEVPFPEKAAHVSCGINHTAVLSGIGSVYTTGDNKFGQLGLGHKTSASSLTRVDIEKVEEISMGHHSGAISFGKLYLWGTGVFGQYLYPKLMACTAEITSLKIGDCSGCALDTHGQVWGWGPNSFKELGPGGAIITPSKVFDSFPTSILTMSQTHCALLSPTKIPKVPEETEVQKLKKQNNQMIKFIEDIEKQKSNTEVYLKDTQASCELYKQIALRVEDLENERKLVAEELDDLRTENARLVEINKRVTRENFELVSDKNTLEMEIERMNQLLWQMENKIMELSQGTTNGLQAGFVRNPDFISKNCDDKRNFIHPNHTEPVKSSKIHRTHNSFSRTVDSFTEYGSENRRKLSQTHLNNFRRLASLRSGTQGIDLYSSSLSPAASKSKFHSKKPENSNKLPETHSIEEIKKMIRITQEKKQEIHKGMKNY